MIDWVSIVRHSRRRISGLGARSPVRMPRRLKKRQISSIPPPPITPINGSSKEDCRVNDSPTASNRSNKLDHRNPCHINTSCCHSPFCVNNQTIKVADTDGNLVKKEQQQQQQQSNATATIEIQQQQPQQQQNNGRQVLQGNADVNIVSPYEVYMLF